MGRTRALGILCALAAATALAPGVQSIAAPGEARLTYGHGSAAEGSVRGSCEGFAFVPSLDAPLNAFGRLSLQIIDLWVNTTLVGPDSGAVALPPEVQRAEHHRTFKPPVRIERGPQSEAYVLDVPRNGPFRAEFDGAAIDADAVRGRDALASIPVEGTAGVVPWSVTPSAAARTVRLHEASTVLAGDARILLRDVRLVDEDATFLLGSAFTQEVTESTATSRRTEHHRYAWLTVEAGRVESGDGALHCAGLALDVEGRWTGFDATGAVTLDGATSSFGDRQLTLVGRFHVAEALEDSREGWRVRAAATGAFDAVDLDFGRRTLPMGSDWVPVGAAVTLALAALAALVGLYSRLREDQILHSKERQEIYDAVKANPGIGFAGLHGQIGGSPTRIRYHLNLLDKAGLIRVLRVQGRHHYLVPGPDAARILERLVITADSKVRDVLLALGGDAVPASQLVREIRNKWGLSRAGGWKVLERAVRSHLIEKRFEKGRLVVRVHQS